MTLDEIKQALEVNTGTFPRLALEQAIERREETVPWLLDTWRQAADAPESLVSKGNDYILHIYAMYLLAQFREPAAYLLLVKFFSTPGELAFDLTGDVVTEDLDAILASVCWNDLAPIKQIIQDTSINEFIRNAALRSMLVLVAEGEMPREELVAYLRDQLTNNPREEDEFWSTLICTAMEIYPEELLDEIESAFADDLADPDMVRPNNVQSRLSIGKEATLQAMKEKYHFIRDTIAEMEWWACFRSEQDRLLRALPVKSPPQHSGIPSNAKVGRNDPCPCGSGKKYKKCCLN